MLQHRETYKKNMISKTPVSTCTSTVVYKLCCEAVFTLAEEGTIATSVLNLNTLSCLLSRTTRRTLPLLTLLITTICLEPADKV